MQYPQLKTTSRRRVESAFTIVELLIVIVVIAILAAISIVAYTGIQNQARATAATSAARQIADKISVYAVENDGYPAALSDVGFSDSNGTTYQYRVNNAIDPKTWCVTATVGNRSFYTSNTQGTPKEGACAGHGSGGMAAITNLHTNPQATSSIGYSNQTPVAGVTALVAGAGPEGQRVYRVSTTQGGQLRIQFKGGVTPVSGGERYSVSLYAKASTAISGVNFEVQYPSAWTKYPAQAISTGWTRLSASLQIPAGVTSIGNMQLLTDGNVGSNVTIDVTKIQITAGETLYGYGDGGSEGWTWNGPPGNSTSTGPPL